MERVENCQRGSRHTIRSHLCNRRSKHVMVKPSHPRAGKSTAPPPSSSKSTASSAGASKHKDPTLAAQPDQDEEMPAPRTSAPTNARWTTRFSSRLPTPSCLPCHARRPQETPGLRSLLRTILRTHLTRRTTTLYSPTEQPASEHGELPLLTSSDHDAQVTCAHTASSNDSPSQAQNSAQARAPNSTPNTAACAQS